MEISSLAGVFSPGAEPVPRLAPLQRTHLVQHQVGQGGTKENVTFSSLFLSGDHPEEEPPFHLLIPVSGGKEAEKPELCESQGTCEGA